MRLTGFDVSAEHAMFDAKGWILGVYRIGGDELGLIGPVTHLGPHHSDLAAIFTRNVEIRLYGNAERTKGACDRAQAGFAFRYYVHVFLPVASCAQARCPFRHAALAGSAVHRACSQPRQRQRVFSDSDRARGRSGRASHGVVSTATRRSGWDVA